MCVHDLSLLGAEPPGFVQNILGDRHLPQVVQKTGDPDRMDVAPAEPYPLSEPRAGCLGISIFFDGSVVVQQAEAVVRNQVHADMRLLFSALGRSQT
jgi:hypothetical protein